MPRIFISVLAGRRGLPIGRERPPARLLAPLRAAGGPRERRQQDEVHDREQGVADESGDGGRDPQVAIPEPLAARAPDVALLKLRRDAAELLVAVVHMENFVA